MAFRNLVEGDCGNPSSLLSLASHYVRDHALTDEGIHRPFAPLAAVQAQGAGQLVQEFLQESACPQTFRMDRLLREMRDIDQSIRPPIMAPGIIRELTSLNWANEYLESGASFPTRHMDDIWKASTNIQPAQRDDRRLLEARELDPTWAKDFVEQSISTVKSDVGENYDPKLAQFKEQVDNIPIENSKAIFNLEGTVEELVEEFNNQRQNDNDSAHAPLSLPNQINDSRFLNRVEEELEAAGSGWGNEFEEYISTRNYDPQVWSHLEEEWDKTTSAGGHASSQNWISEYEKYYDPYKNYEFQETNPMRDISDALIEGKRLLAEGNLPGAILCFEAAIQQDKDNIEAWLLLGKTQAENEQDSLAIPALRQCLNLDPSNCVALMALAVSYTNESYQRQACLTLKEWLLKNERYKHLSICPESNIHLSSSLDTRLEYKDIHREVKDLFIQAARMNPRDGIDADVQCGLGVLFSLSNDYDKASDCFKTALQIRPDDSRLWNRWGASLANGQRSAEAIAAYRRALELSPGFIRARYNLGISCINLAAFQQAAEHFLIALNQQAEGSKHNATSKTMSNSIWSILRLVISLLNKFHLVKAIEQRDLTTLNKEFELT